MFREMRRFKQVLSKEECIQVLNRGTNGVLAVIGDDGYPYTVPLSYCHCDSKIYFHSAKAGHKIDALEKNDKVSFCVVDADNIVSEKFTTYFRSVIVFGKARILRDEEKRFALELLIDKYSKEFSNNKEAEISGSFNAVSCIELTIEHMSGKEAIEYIREKESNN